MDENNSAASSCAQPVGLLLQAASSFLSVHDQNDFFYFIENFRDDFKVD